MSAIASLCHVNPSVSEDSLVLKTLACVPLAGLVVSLFEQVTLNMECAKINEPHRAAELIEVKNKYKICDITRLALTIILVIAGIAAGILPTVYISVAVVLFGAIGFHAYGIHKNIELIHKIHSNELTDGRYPIH